MPEVSRRTFVKAAGSGAVMTALAGCTGGGGGDGETDTTTDENETTTETTTSDGNSGDSENELVALFGKKVGTIDPHRALDDVELLSSINYYDPFVYFTPDNTVVAHVAQDWNVKQDGKVWQFTIRDDITTHAGNDLTAEDVVYSADRFVSMDQGFSSLWEGFYEKGNARAIDEKTVEFTLEKPYGPFFGTLVLFFMVDSAVVKDNAGDDMGKKYLSSNVAGSGPYTLGHWQSGNEITYEAFPDYWKGWEDDQFDLVRGKIVLEESTQRQLMEQGSGDISDPYLSPEAYEAMNGFDNVMVPQGIVANQLFHLPIHCQKKPTDDPKVREAMVKAFDYQTAINDIMGGGKQAAGPVPWPMPGHADELEPYSQDVEAAKQALEESEYSMDEINANTIEVMYLGAVPVERKMGLLLKSNLKEIGMTNVELKSTTWANFTDACTSEDSTPQVSQVYHTAKFASPDSHTYLMFHPSSHGSWISASWYSTDELTQTLEDARAEPDTEKRYDLYKEAQRLATEGYPSIFLVNPPFRLGINKNVKGYNYRSILGYERTWYNMARKGDGRAK